LSFATIAWPDIGGTIPGKNTPFTPSSILFRPAETRRNGFKLRVLVEAPGTAPGSEWFIATAIYFHSRRTGTPNIGRKGRERQSRKS
jgi:hypothetical protein